MLLHAALFFGALSAVVTIAAFVPGIIRARIWAGLPLGLGLIALVAWNGNVYLLGRVTEREAERATEVTRGVSGVQKVVKVFQIISEAELANTAPKPPPAKP